MAETCPIAPSPCAPCDFPILNLTSENEDKEVFIGISFQPIPPIPPRIGQRWFATGCLSICESLISQEDADLCAARQNAFCTTTPPPPGLVANQPQSCTVTCPDGSPFVFHVAAGLFIDTTVAGANAAAHAFACAQARLQRLCFGPLEACTCVGSQFSRTVIVTGVPRALTFFVSSGSLPDGLVLLGGSMQFRIAGIPTTSGTFNFTIEGVDGGGNFMRKPYTIAVIEVSTVTLTDYTVGTPYSLQLTATGGSGNYSWKITSGVLPDGLVMDVTGLIHGTPTGVNTGTMPLVFSIIDTDCEQANESFFPPRVALVTRSTTTIATVLGYPEYLASSPPKKYHKLTWSGTAEQTAIWWPHAATPPFLGNISDAKYVYSGTGEIDSFGNQIDNYTKNYFTPCPASSLDPSINSPGLPMGTLRGYCYTPDPGSCPVCSLTPLFKSDQASDQIFDQPGDLFGGNSFTLTSTSLTCDTGGFIGVAAAIAHGLPNEANNVPLVIVNGQLAAWTIINSNINVTSLLEDEYTDAEAIANAQIINSNGSTAQTLARTTGFTSQWTTVSFVLNFSNLVVGQAYVASVDLWDSPTNSHTTRAYGFIAAATTHAINDAVPTPAQGHTITVRLPTVAFAP